MAAVVPSQIVAFIDGALSYVQADTRALELYPSTCAALNALLRLIEELPSSLLPADGNAYAELVQSVESIRFGVETARSQGVHSTYGFYKLQPDGAAKPSQVRIIREILSHCPDETPPRTSNELLSIRHQDVRDGFADRSRGSPECAP